MNSSTRRDSTRRNGWCRRGYRWSAALGALALAGCATFSRDGGFSGVADTAQARLGKQVRWLRTPEERAEAQAQVAALMQRPLSVDEAVQIALLNNPALQAAFQELGISEAELVQSGRLPNPRLTLRHASAGGVYDIEETASISVLSVLTAPYAHAIEKRRFSAAQDAAAAEIVQLAARTREAYFNALAARESAHYLATVKDAAETGADLARRMRAAGNWNRIDEGRERSFYLSAALASERARSAETVALENLAVQLGVGAGADGPRLAERLPELPPGVEELPGIERMALENRIDLKMMRARIDALAKDLKLTKVTRFVNVLDAGPARIRQGPASEPYESGYEISLEVPLFDGGGARIRRAEARYAQAVESFAAAAIEARAQVRKAYARYRAAHEIAIRERDEVLPLRKAITQEDLLRYDAAQISVFDLLADARGESGAVDEYIQSERDFWIAKSALDAALAGRTQQPEEMAW
jgi:outer membrane protein TolC